MKRLSILMLLLAAFIPCADGLEIHDGEFLVLLEKSANSGSRKGLDDLQVLKVSIVNLGSTPLEDVLIRIFLDDSLRYSPGSSWNPGVAYQDDLHMLTLEFDPIEAKEVRSGLLRVRFDGTQDPESFKITATGSANRRIGNTSAHVTNWSETLRWRKE
ncbi:MAG: hypothetical protein C4530_24195 [Desulfobacteraceae bacterium]|nr:MAG: hypothetical protein C4530_24195 [Desulfobacteraceae bacterium]